MRNWRDTVVSADTPLRETLANLSRTGAQIALVLDNSGKLQGVVTDGDVRKAILAGIELDSPTPRSHELLHLSDCLNSKCSNS